MSWKTIDDGWNSEYHFESKAEPVQEQKSVQTPDSSIVGMLQDVDRWDMSFRLLNEYYKRCAPLASAINYIADAGCEIPPRLQNVKTKKYIDNHPIIDLLTYPNDRTTGTDFMRALIAFYLINGNPLLRSLGPVQRPPLALKIDQPQFAEINPDSVGDVKNIMMNTEFGTRSYVADSVDGRKRYRRGKDDELWHIYSFNPDEGSRQFFGAPIARPLYYDIELYVYGSKHNKTLLKRGARPSGAISMKPNEFISGDDFIEVEQQIQKGVQGLDNVGRVLVMQWGEYQQLSQTNKDMEYKELIERATLAPYRHFKIPLPLIVDKSMTYDNFASSQIALYDQAVMPTVRFLFEQIWAALMYRYEKNWRDYRLVINEDDIPALLSRRIKNVENLSKVKVNTVNELRAMAGYPEVDGGDEIWRPSSDAPILSGEDDNDG